jgi:phosphatidylglycerophosphate synthase
MFRKNVANVITIFRILLTPAIAYSAVSAANVQFVGFAAVAMLTDMVDGTLARKLNAESPRGQVLDSIADFMFYPVFTCGSLFLMHITRYIPLYFIIPVLALPLISTFLLPLLIAGKIVFLHLRTWQLTSYALVLFCFVSILSNVNIVLFYTTVVCMTLACIEETAMYIRDRERVDPRVHSYFEHIKNQV